MNLDRRFSSSSEKWRNARSSSVQGVPKKKLVVDNTFQMGPSKGKDFIWYKARGAVQKVAADLLDDYQYEGTSAGHLCLVISTRVMKKVKKLDCPRHRFMCHVTLAQLKKQGLMVAHRSLWNIQTDSYAYLTHQSRDFVCVITLHAVYYE